MNQIIDPDTLGPEARAAYDRQMAAYLTEFPGDEDGARLEAEQLILMYRAMGAEV